MARTLVFTDEELVALGDIVDFWLEGYDEATQQVATDRSIETPEMLVNAVTDMHRGFELSNKILDQIRRPVKS